MLSTIPAPPLEADFAKRKCSLLDREDWFRTRSWNRTAFPKTVKGTKMDRANPGPPPHTTEGRAHPWGPRLLRKMATSTSTSVENRDLADSGTERLCEGICSSITKNRQRSSHDPITGGHRSDLQHRTAAGLRNPVRRPLSIKDRHTMARQTLRPMLPCAYYLPRGATPWPFKTTVLSKGHRLITEKNAADLTQGT